MNIIFDLDGTLWDSAKNVVIAYNKVLENYPDISYKMTERKLKSYMGKTLKEITKLFFYDLPEEKGLQIMNECSRSEIEYLKENGGILFPKLEETLIKLCQKHVLFIVSNCQAGYIEAFLEYNKLGKYFKDYECPGNTNLPTKAENIILLMNRNNINVTNSIYVGDTQR